MKNKNGITLISLVITIIVLLILATVAISLAVDSNGLFSKANEAKLETRAGAVEESASMWKTENLMARYTNEAERSLDDILQELEEKDLLTSDEVAQVKSIGQVTIGSKTIVFKELEETPASEFETIELEDGTIAIIKYTGTSKNIVFPKKIDGKTVTAIGTQYEVYDSWDVVESGLLSIYIPNTVKIIGDGAFDGSFAENSNAIIYIPDSVEYIGEYAFECNGIKEVHLTDSVLKIGEYAFWDNNIEEIHIPNKLERITDESFACNKIKEVIIPDSVKYIETYAFSNNKIENLIIPTSVTYIEGGAFTNNCLPEEQAYIYNRKADGTEEKTSLNSYAGGATTAIIPNNVEIIGYNAFWCCENLETVIIQDGVNTIQNWAFRNCTALNNITLSSNLTSIGSAAFNTIANPSTIYVPNETVKSLLIDGTNYQSARTKIEDL